MVDPKRHINILSEGDQLFLNECEEEFKERWTDDDAEFQAYCAQPSPPPPVLEPWQNRGGGGGDRRHDGGGGGRGRGRFQHNYHHNNRNRDYRDRPYNRGESGHHGNRYSNSNNRDNNNRDNNNRYNSDRRY